MYGKAKSLDALADLEKSNRRVIEAIATYKNLMDDYKDKLTDQMFKEVGERCVERLRFLGQLSQAVKIHEALIERFSEDSYYRNQLAVTYLLMNE